MSNNGNQAKQACEQIDLTLRSTPTPLRRGSITDIPQQGHIAKCLEILHAACFQSEIPIPDLHRRQGWYCGLCRGGVE